MRQYLRNKAELPPSSSSSSSSAQLSSSSLRDEILNKCTSKLDDGYFKYVDLSDLLLSNKDAINLVNLLVLDNRYLVDSLNLRGNRISGDSLNEIVNMLRPLRTLSFEANPGEESQIVQKYQVRLCLFGGLYNS